MVCVCLLESRNQQLRRVGHEGAITNLITHPSYPQILISSSHDQDIRVWDWSESQCLAIYTSSFKLDFLCLHPRGTTFLSSGGGNIFSWKLLPPSSLQNGPLIKFGQEDARLVVKHAADWMQYIDDDILVTKNKSNEITQWNLSTHPPKVDCSIDVPLKEGGKQNQNGSMKSRCLIIEEKGDANIYLVAGNLSGVLYFYNLSTGSRVCRIEYPRSSCQISDITIDLLHKTILFTSALGFLWRCDLLDGKALAENSTVAVNSETEQGEALKIPRPKQPRKKRSQPTKKKKKGRKKSKAG